MKFKFNGKFDGNYDSLPVREHLLGAVKFQEIDDLKKIGLIMNVLAFVVMLPLLAFFFLRSGIDGIRLWPCIFFFPSMIIHEVLHAIWFKEEVTMYTNLKMGMLFVTGCETMSKFRFCWMSIFPNLVFGFIPFFIYLINPSFVGLGFLGVLSIPSGMGDYMNIYHALTQMPKGARCYMYKQNTYWYLPKGE